MSNAWPMVRLGEVLTRSAETVVISPDSEYREVTVKLWGKGVVLRGIISGAQIAGSRRFVAKSGQFILSRIDARHGATGIVPSELNSAVVTNDFPLFNLELGLLDAEFFGWLTKTRTFVELCRQASEGTTNRVRLQEKRFLSLEIPLPPLSEQRRTVARIEELAAKVTEAQSLRKKASEEAETLLTTTRRVSMSTCEARFVELEDVCSAIIDNLHSNPSYAETGVPCVRSPDVGYGCLDLEGALRTDETEFRRRTVRGEPQVDDIVLVREGGGTGKCALVAPRQRFSLGQRVMMLRPNPKKILPTFFLHQLLSPLVQENQIRSRCKGSASPHLNIGALKRFVLRLPSLSEQNRIVAYLDNVQAKLAALKLLQSETAAELDAMLPAILDRAFKGEL